MKIKHFLFTRFNLGYLDYYQVNSPYKWLEFRSDLFYALTYPTVVIQTQTNFKWVLLFDKATPADFIENFKSRDSNLIFDIEYTTLDEVPSFVLNYMKLNSSKDDILVSTTLDSDDGIFPKFISTIQKNLLLHNQFPFGININDGYIVDVNSGIFHKKSFLSNPFYSLVELQENAKGIYCYSHHILKEKFHTINIDNNNLWIQNIHGSNLLNKVKGEPLLNCRSIDSRILNIYGFRKHKALIIAFILYGKQLLINFSIKFRKFISNG